MDTNTLANGVPKVNCFIIPFKDVFATLEHQVFLIRPGIWIDWNEYIRCTLNYVFDEHPACVPALQFTECRTMLSGYGFTVEQLAWIEHCVISMAVMLIGDTHAYIKMLSKENLIAGFYWDINNCRDLVINLAHR